MQHKVLFIADSLNETSSGAKTNTISHLRVFQEIYGLENVICINLVGTKHVSNNEYLSLSVSSNIMVRVTLLLCGYTGKINPTIMKSILDMINKEKIDIVFIDNATYGLLVKKIKEHFPKMVVISFYHDVKANLCKEWIKKEPQKMLVYHNVMRNERICSENSDVNLILNEREKKEFNNYYPGIPCDMLKVSVKAPDIRMEANPIQHPLKILFLGSYYYPNVNGIKWFIENVYNQLDSKKIRLQVSGSGMERLKDNFSRISGVTVTGRVDDLGKTYTDCDIVIGSIFEGAGMKVKTAEALSYGKCYIGTSESLEGYLEDIPNNVIGKYMFVANSASEFIESIETVLLSSDIKRFNKEIYNVFIDKFSLQTSKKKLETVINCAFENCQK